MRTTTQFGSIKPTDTPALHQLLRLLDRPIAFQRCFVNPTGSITAALMLSQAVYWQQRTKHEDGWWYKKQEEWTDEIGLSRREQENARRKLRKLGVLHEDRRGVPAQLWFKVDEFRLLEILAKPVPTRPEPAAAPVPDCPKALIQIAPKRQSGLAETAIQECTNPPILLAQKRQSFKGTETTTEISTETTTTTPQPLSSNDETVTTEPACGGCGNEDQNQEDQTVSQELATAETEIEEKTVIQEEAQPAVATTECGDTPIENQKTVASEVAIEDQPPELTFPAKLTEREYHDMATVACLLPLLIAQQMLDVVAAKIKAGQIRTNPAAVFRGIVRKYKADPGSFDPSMGFGIAENRRRRLEEAARAEAEAEQREQVREGSRITPAARAAARQSIAHIKQLLRGHV